MRIRITVENLETKSDTYNDFEWEVDGDCLKKGRAVENMMEMLNNTKNNF
jgi:hypothetical protein